VLTATGLLGTRLSLPVLRMLEGYWPAFLDPVKRLLLWTRALRLDRDGRRWRELAVPTEGNRTSGDQSRFIRLTAQRHRTPPNRRDRMPTGLGDILRAAEVRPGARYGLDAVTCWPRLWLTLPDTTKAEVVTSRDRLDLAAQWWLWGVLTVVWAGWAWWAIGVAVLVTAIAYLEALAAAEVYGVIVLACFDVHRGLLYAALGRPAPQGPDERADGASLSAFLERGPSRQPARPSVSEDS